MKKKEPVAIRIVKADITTANAGENAPKTTTRFKGDSIAIDTAECRCLDCQSGDAIPFNEANARTLALLGFQVKYQGRKVFSRLPGSTYVDCYQNDWEFGIIAYTEALAA